MTQEQEEQQISIIPLTSPSHAPALALIKLRSFKSSQLSCSAFPAIIHEPQLMEAWYVTREMLDLEDPARRHFAVVQEVDGQEELELGVDSGLFITVPSSEKSNVQGGVEEKCYAILAWARWFNLPDGNLHRMDIDVKLGGDDEEASADVKRKRDDLLLRASAVPAGTVQELSRAVRSKLGEARKKYVDEERDCVLELICTNPEHERKGYARRLLQQGLALADATDRRVYLESTPMAVQLYEDHGWQKIDVVEWTLADYGVAGDGDGAGKIEITLMMREPVGMQKQK